MNRIVIFLLVVVLAALAVVYALRLSQRASTTAVTSLLPRETVAFVHLSDFNRTRDQWHQSDIYQLYREPVVQDFLGRPLSRVPKTTSVSNTVQEIEQLDLKDGFVAVTSLANDDIKVVGGFRFRGSQDDAEKVIARWRGHLPGNTAQGETVEYEHHKIEVAAGGPRSLKSAYDGNWFFAANDLDELKAILDRADGRAKDRQALLSADGAFREAMNEMPASYAGLFYMQPKTLGERSAALRAWLGQPTPPNQKSMFEQMRSMCITTRFDNGKMHDVAYIGMPKQEQDETLSRSSLALATRDTFLYGACLMNLSKQLSLLDSSATGNFLAAPLKKINGALAAAKVSPDDWKAAFGSEFGILSDWAADKHWPSIVAACQVKDAARTKRMVAAVLHAIDEDATWAETDRNGVHYWLMEKGPNFFSLRPVVAMSNRFLLTGLDEASVESAMRRSENPTFELSNSEAYKRAAKLVPEPTTLFTYLDLGLFYSRLDATLRPLLLMSAAFMPAINEYVDVGKLPTADVVTKHLTPIVSSRRYNGHGYVAESAGPITLDQSIVGGGILAGMGVIGYQRGFANTLVPFGLPTRSPAPPAMVPKASATPSQTP